TDTRSQVTIACPRLFFCAADTAEIFSLSLHDALPIYADVQEDLLRRAEAAGVRTLLLTSDAVLIGNREWDRRNFARPLQLTWRNKFDVLRHPGWIRQALWPQGMPKMGNLLPYLPADASNTAGAAHFMAHKMEMGLCWDSLARLRQCWPHRLILKGVQTGTDARRCVAMGLD